MPRRIGGRSPRSTGWNSLVRIRSSPAITARKLAALAAKHQPTPTAAMTSPPMPGPKIRDALNRLELRATAFESSRRPTMRNVSACRAGPSRTMIVPLTAAIA